MRLIKIRKFEDIQGVDIFNNEFNRPTFAFIFGIEASPVQIYIRRKNIMMHVNRKIRRYTGCRFNNEFNRPTFTFIFGIEAFPVQISVWRKIIVMHVKIRRFENIQGVDTFNNEFNK